MNEDVRLLKLSPLRKNVLLVEPCSLGQVPVASVYQPAPVFGGNACWSPFCPRTPWSISDAYVGIAPWPA